MFQLTVNDITYSVDFEHAQYDPECNTIELPSGKKKNVSAITTAILEAKVGNEFAEVHREESHCSPPDVFNKSRGRKIALARLLNVVFPSSLSFSENDNNKEVRSLFWDEYNSRINSPQYSMPRFSGAQDENGVFQLRQEGA